MVEKFTICYDNTNMRLNYDIGELIKRWRLSKGWDQQKLGDAIGLSRSAVSNFERGKRSPSIEKIFRICDALGIDIVTFWRGPRKNNGVVTERRKNGTSGRIIIINLSDDKMDHIIEHIQNYLEGGEEYPFRRENNIS